MMLSLLAVLLDLFDAGLRRVERQVDHALEAVVLGQDALDQPFVVGGAERDLELVLRMHAERQHRRRKYHVVVEAERVHGAARQLDEVVGALRLDLLQQRLLMRDAPVDMLVENAGLVVEQRDVAGAGATGQRLTHLADHLVVDRGEDFRPERGLGDVSVDIDQEVVLVALRLPRGMRENVARVGLHRDFVQFAELRRRALEHGGLPDVARHSRAGARSQHTDPTGRRAMRGRSWMEPMRSCSWLADVAGPEHPESRGRSAAGVTPSARLLAAIIPMSERVSGCDFSHFRF